MTFLQPHPRACTPAASVGSFCQWLHHAGYKPDDQGVPCQGLCPLGYHSLSSLAETTCFCAPLAA